MLKHILYLSFLFFTCQPFFSQNIISGKILTEDNKYISTATIYLNNTTISANSGIDGSFELNPRKGSYTLVISSPDYITQQIPVEINNKNISLKIHLTKESLSLDEIMTYEKTKLDAQWKNDLNRFKTSLFGASELAKECIIKNKEVLRFDYNKETKAFTAKARKPLLIENRSLGYLIYYDLVTFNLVENRLFYSGYMRFEDTQDSFEKTLLNNRLKAFNGSRMHFLRSLTQRKTKEEGFVIHQFKRNLNKDRPSDSQLKEARQIALTTKSKIKKNGQTAILKKTLDSAMFIVRKGKNPKFLDTQYKTNLADKDLISKKDYILDFDDYLTIIYTKEKQDKNYITGSFDKNQDADIQKSHLTLQERKTKIIPFGIFANPNSFFNEGYWSYEAFPNLLPLDYIPTKN